LAYNIEADPRVRILELSLNISVPKDDVDVVVPDYYYKVVTTNFLFQRLLDTYSVDYELALNFTVLDMSLHEAVEAFLVCIFAQTLLQVDKPCLTTV
jgi:hypothetical protein